MTPSSENGHAGNHEEIDDTVRDEPGGSAPRRIGNYSIRRQIASGGMGTVYEAIQEQPRRTVAVKVMRAGLFSDAALRRFEYEAQLLARLRHPGVAQIYEAGTHRESGENTPFFAMEYIANARTITDYAREKRLTTRERLELFVHVCDAVHHGHQRGIVHRDLKPGNILVDSAGRPRIIDFGVARATDSDMAAAAHQTEVGQLVGSLQYMSPEQFDADPHDIDTRSDVYALGLVLYELLSGKLPYEIRRSRIHEAAARVRESEPVPLGRLDASLRGDVETLVGHALEKERDRRYQSAFGLREDISRYLSGDAIGARPPTFTYQLRVLARRNKPWIVAAAVALVAVIGGGVLSTIMYFKAESARSEAELHAARSQAAVDFIGDMMREMKPEGWGHQPTIGDLVHTLRERVDVVFAEEPVVASDLHLTLGWASLPLEEFEMFERHCSTAAALRRENLGPDDPRTLSSLYDLARAQSILGRHVDHLETWTEIATLCEKNLGGDDMRTLDAYASLATAYELMGRYRDAQGVAADVYERCSAVVGEEHRATAYHLAHLAGVHLKLGDRAQALTMAQRAYDVSRSHPGEARPMEFIRSALAAAFIANDRVDDAATLYDQGLPGDAGIVKSFQGSTELSGAGPQMLVMWETWCPFSQRVVPVVEDIFRRHQEAGLGVTALTRVNKSSSDERVTLFIREQQLSFPVLKDSGKSWSYFGASGTPFIVLLDNGRVVWKNYVDTAADLSDRLIRDLMAARAISEM